MLHIVTLSQVVTVIPSCRAALNSVAHTRNRSGCGACGCGRTWWNVRDFPPSFRPLLYQKCATTVHCNTLRCTQMALNLAASQHSVLRDMIVDGGFNYPEAVQVTYCSNAAVKTRRRNLRSKACVFTPVITRPNSH